MKRTVVTLVVLLAGCSGGSSHSTKAKKAQATESPIPAPSVAESALTAFATPAAIAAKLACTNVKAATSPRPGAKATGYCTATSGDLTISTFANDPARKKYVSLAGPYAPHEIYGKNWVIDSYLTQNQKVAIAKTLGGTLS